MDGLVKSPVFVISTVRSGPTPLRCVLNTRSRVYAGHEMHLGGTRVGVGTDPAVAAMKELGLSGTELDSLSDVFRDQPAGMRLPHGPEEIGAKVRDSAPAQVSPMFEALAEARAGLDGITVRAHGRCGPCRHPVSAYT
ncbi:hypothetical protein ACFV1C_01160 [Streptomyces sp. NPDC059605]|uniref:hypothetical protein n=1 Tax=unclassified Streptomyces TaxID=2593676 RepID=UPI00368D890F